MNHDADALSVPIIPQLAGLEEKPIGQAPIVQTFYEGPVKPQLNGATNWVEKQPLQVPDGVQERYDSAAIRLYKLKDFAPDNTFGGLTPMKDFMFQIKSPMIIKAVEPILNGFGTHAVLNTITIYAPFKELFFSHHAIMDRVHQEEPGTELRENLDLMLKVINELLTVSSQTIGALQTKGQITWEYLWAIYPKDIIVYSRIRDQDRFYQVTQTRKDPNLRWHIDCKFVCFDGSDFGYLPTSFSIDFFRGARSISTLMVYPVGFLADLNLKKKIVERARRVLDCQGICYKECPGTGILASSKYDLEAGRALHVCFQASSRKIC